MRDGPGVMGRFAAIGSASVGLRAQALVLALAFGAAQPASACGYHDPASINLGMLNLAYPDALHVRTAVWTAQQEGLIARDDPASGSAPLASNPLSRFDPAGPVATLAALRNRMGAALDGEVPPAVSLVFIKSMLWTRYRVADGAFEMTVHASGPERDDVVIVTDAPALAAVVDGSISPTQARALGLLLLYGTPQGIDAVAALFARLKPVGAESTEPAKVSMVTAPITDSQLEETP